MGLLMRLPVYKPEPSRAHCVFCCLGASYIPCCAVLCCAMLCCVMLCYAMLCYAMLCCAMLSYAMLCYAVLCCPMLCCAVLCSAVRRNVVATSVTVIGRNKGVVALCCHPRCSVPPRLFVCECLPAAVSTMQCSCLGLHLALMLCCQG